MPEHTIIIAATPHAVDWGLELSSVLQEKIPRIKELIFQEIGILEKTRG